MNEADNLKLVEWEKQLRLQMEELQLRRREVDLELQKVVRKLDLVRQMLAVEGLETENSKDFQHDSASRVLVPTVKEFVKTILQEAGRPLHINEIHKEFLNRGYQIPGAGTPFNILVHIVRDKTFARVARGTYALNGTVPANEVLPIAHTTGKRKRRKRRRRRVQREVVNAKS